MADGKCKEAWNRTSELWAVLAESNRDRKKRHAPYTAADIHPYARKGPPAKLDPKAAFNMFRDILVRPGGKHKVAGVKIVRRGTPGPTGSSIGPISPIRPKGD